MADKALRLSALKLIRVAADEASCCSYVTGPRVRIRYSGSSFVNSASFATSGSGFT